MSKEVEERKQGVGKLQRKKHRTNGFEQWGGYMESKKLKLSEQFSKNTNLKHLDLLEEGEERSEIFKGVSIFVNGYTKPSADELKRLMMIHGGKYHYYYSTSSTTHTIASNLPDSKIRNLGSQVVVTADWIVDSIKAGKLLPHQDYLLYPPEVTEKQRRLNFLPVNNNQELHVEKVNVINSENCSSGTSKELTETVDKNDTGMGSDSIFGDSPEELKSSSEKVAAEHDTIKSIEHESKIDKLCTLNSDCNSDDQIAPAQSNASSLKAGHPEFLSEFYSHSRLHHISTAGQELKRYLQCLVEANGEKHFPAREKLKQEAHIVGNSSEVSWDNRDSSQVLMHLDMDCFFVSVGLKKYPELRGQPVAVTHSRGKRGGAQEGSDPNYEVSHYTNESKKKLGGVVTIDTDSAEQPKISKYSKEFGSLSEIASCSYEAREAGVRNGMFLGEALRKCPNLKTIPYDFEGYSEVSKLLYDIVASYTLDIEAVSCDELYVDCTELLQDTGLAPLQFTSILRAEIEEKTGCTASAGLGSNMLLARLSNKHAKPNGQYYIQSYEIDNFMKEQKVRDLPGVGYTTSKKLEHFGVNTCEDLKSWSLSRLQKEFGSKTGLALFDRCRGKCNRKLQTQKERKSVSAEINYGIRFELEEDIYKFINELSMEVQNRLQHIHCKGKSLTLKLMIRRPDAPLQTAKFMGHGVCNSISKSVLLKSATSDASVIGRECCTLSRMLKIKPQDYRGVGVQVSKLEPVQNEGKTISDFLLVEKKDEAIKTSSDKEVFAPKLQTVTSPQKKNTIKELFSKTGSSHKPTSNETNITAEQLDQSVLNALPEDLRNEVLKTYGLPVPSKASKPASQQPQLKKQKKSSTACSMGMKSIISAFNREPDPKVSQESTKKSRATLGGAEHINDIRNMLKEWIHNNEGIIEEDVEHFKEYLLKLVDEDLEKLNLILKYFYRLSSRTEKSWQDVYLRVLSHVQQKMLHSYGSMLDAKSDFLCS